MATGAIRVMWEFDLKELSFALVMMAIAALYVIPNHSAVSSEYICESEDDKGRLQVNIYRWWVKLWSESKGDAKFQSLKMAEYFPRIFVAGEGSFMTVYADVSSPLHTKETFLAFMKATGSLHVGRYTGYMFEGECVVAN